MHERRHFDCIETIHPRSAFVSIGISVFATTVMMMMIVQENKSSVCCCFVGEINGELLVCSCFYAFPN